MPKLKTPHYTEKVELKEPLEFPCKANYEKINVTIDGLKEKERLDASPDNLPLCIPPGDDDEENDDDDDDDNEDPGGGDGDGPGGGGGSAIDAEIRRDVEELEMEGALEAPRRADLPPPPGLEQVVHEPGPEIEIPEDTPWSITQTGSCQTGQSLILWATQRFLRKHG